jgi:type II secretory pathway pseudopilin PulG
MLQDSRGFFLVDALVGLSIILFVLSAIIPVLYNVYQEQQAIIEERAAMEVLHNRLQDWLNNNQTDLYEEVISYHNTTYYLDLENVENGVKLCVSWNARNKRFYEMCGNAK